MITNIFQQMKSYKGIIGRYDEFVKLLREMNNL